MEIVYFLAGFALIATVIVLINWNKSKPYLKITAVIAIVATLLAYWIHTNQ